MRISEGMVLIMSVEQTARLFELGTIVYGCLTLLFFVASIITIWVMRKQASKNESAHDACTFSQIDPSQTGGRNVIARVKPRKLVIAFIPDDKRIHLDKLLEMPGEEPKGWETSGILPDLEVKA